MTEKCKGVIFDLGMTLIYPPLVGRFMERLAEFDVRVDKEELKNAFRFADRFMMDNHPGLLNQEVKEFYPFYASLMLSYLHVSQVPVAEFSKNMMEKSPPRSEWKLYPDTIPCLTELRKRGFKIGVVSNWDLKCRELLEQLELTPYLDYVVVSSEIGIEKPAPGPFRKCLEGLGITAGEAIYVGDNFRDDIQGANNVGIKALYLQRKEENQLATGWDFRQISALNEVFAYIG